MRLARWILVTLTCAGCTPSDAPGTVVARVGEVAITRAELDLHLSVNLVPIEGADAAAPEIDRVKSRLLDALIDETMLVIEAERLGLEVSETEIDAALAASESTGAAPSPRLRQTARQRLLVQALMERVVASLPPGADAPDSVARAHDAAPADKRVRLRALRFDSAERASEAAESIKSGRMTFAEAVAAHASGPGQGVPVEMSWPALSPVIQQALEGLAPDEVSRPVSFNGEVYLFQVDGWLAASDPRTETPKRTQAEANRERLRQASDALLESLRHRTSVEIRERRLPFRYVR